MHQYIAKIAENFSRVAHCTEIILTEKSIDLNRDLNQWFKS